MSVSPAGRNGVLVYPMRETDLVQARRICRVAFGTFVGAPDPEHFMRDRDHFFTRWKNDAVAGLSAEVDGALAGSNFVTRWGSFGFFGPLTVRPELWNRGVAKALLGPTVELFDHWDVRHSGLFTFANSPKHVGLYQKFGFWPRFLTALMSKSAAPASGSALRYSALDAAGAEQALCACRELTGTISEGLDVTAEIRAVRAQNIGETLLLWGGTTLDAFAVCHCGEGTEAGRGGCYVKFGVARPGAGAERSFDRLLDECLGLAAERGLDRLDAGVNLARGAAYRHLLQRGFRATMQGVAMQRPDAPGHNRPDVWALDDWR